MQKCGLTHRQTIQTSPRRISYRVPWLKWSEFNQSGEIYRCAGNLQRWVWPTQWALCMKLSLGIKSSPQDGKLRTGTSNRFVLETVALFRQPAWRILYFVMVSCKEPIYSLLLLVILLIHLRILDSYESEVHAKRSLTCGASLHEQTLGFQENERFPKVDKAHQRAGSRRRF